MSPRQWLNAYGQRYARPWAKYDEMIAKLRPELRWPEWCWCPVAASYAIVSSAAGPASDIGALAGLAAWRVGQGVYRFPEALERELWRTPVAGAIPSDVLQRLPEYCCYVPTPTVDGIEGFWAFLEWDAHDCGTELRFVLNAGDHLVPLALPVDGRLCLEESIARLVASVRWQAQRRGISLPGDVGSLEMWHGMTSLTLFLCSRNAEIRPITADAAKRGEPRRAQPTKTRHGMRYYPPDAPIAWEAGSRIGPALAAALERQGQQSGGGEGRSRRAHVRRAHWHTYRVGQGRQLSELRWLHPILVGGDPESLAETIREIPD